MQPTNSSSNPNLNVGKVRYHDKQCYIVLPGGKEVSVVHITGAENKKIFTAGQTLTDRQAEFVLEILRVSFAGQNAILDEVAKRTNPTTVTFQPASSSASVTSNEAYEKYGKIETFKLTAEKMQAIQKVYSDAITFLFAADKKSAAASAAAATVSSSPKVSNPTVTEKAAKKERVLAARAEIQKLFSANKFCNAHKIRKILNDHNSPRLEKIVQDAFVKEFVLTDFEKACHSKLAEEIDEKESHEDEKKWLKDNKKHLESMLKKEMAKIFIKNLEKSVAVVKPIKEILERIERMKPDHKDVEPAFREFIRAFNTLP